MKTVEYRGAVLQVENWVRFITTDENGTMCGFECRPQIDGNEWWRGPEVGAMCVIEPNNDDWRDSLVELPE